MADYKLIDTELVAVANAIRTKGGTSAPLEWPNGFISAINAIPTGGGPTIVSWATGTDAEIVAMLEAAHAGDIDLQTDGGWAIGDVRTISISSFVDGAGVTHDGESIDIVITSFDDYMNCGCVMQFDFKQSLSVGARMNPQNTTNDGGYPAMEMKAVTIPALVQALPTWLKNILIEFSCLCRTGIQESSPIATVTGNKLALRSEVELTGGTASSRSGEGSLIPYYSTSSNRFKKLGRNGSNTNYWTRSEPNNYAGVFVNMSSVIVNQGYTNNIYNTYGIAPFGCI